MQVATIQQADTNFATVNRAIEALDLTKATTRLMLPEPKGKGWTPEEAVVAVKWYKRFLALAAKYPERTLIPSVLVDEVWHQHVLDTRQYPEDCKAIFGEFLHHNPYFGSTEEGARLLDMAFAATNELYRIEFGEDIMTAEPLDDLRAVAQSCK